MCVRVEDKGHKTRSFRIYDNIYIYMYVAVFLFDHTM